MADQLPRVDLDTPRLSPDGTTILFTFRYGNLPHKLAMAPVEPADGRISILPAPPTVNWRHPAWAPDGNYFAATSYCEGDDCYEGAKGYNVWRFAIRPGPDNLRRLTPDRTGVVRSHPFFGRGADDVHWVLSAEGRSDNPLSDLSRRVVARLSDGRETILLPDDAEFLQNGRVMSAKATFDMLVPAQGFGGGALYFVARTISGTLPATRAAVDAKLRNQRALFRWRGGDTLELVQDTPVIAVDAQRFGSGYVTVSRVPNYASQPVEFHVVRNGVAKLRLSFNQGNVPTVSMSENMDTIVFSSFRTLADPWRLWVHRKDMERAIELDVAERVRREVARQIELERSR